MQWHLDRRRFLKAVLRLALLGLLGTLLVATTVHEVRLLCSVVWVYFDQILPVLRLYIQVVPHVRARWL